MEDVEVLQVNTQPAQQSVAGLRNEIKRLKGELLSLEQGSKEYNEVLAEVANKTHELKEITEQVNRSSADFGDRLRNVQGTVAGVSGAFQTVLGSLSLMGVQIGDDVKMLKMLQSAMAITQGVAAIDTGVKAFKALTISIKASTEAMSGLKKALITSGIGAAAIAVGILATKLAELKKEQEAAAEAARKHNEELREQLKISNQLAKAESDYYNEKYKQIPIVEALEKKLAENRAYWQKEYQKGNINQLTLDEKIEEERVKYITNAGQKMSEAWQTILAHNTDATWKESKEGKRIWNDYFNWRAVAAYGDLEEQKRLMQEWEEFSKKKVENVNKAKSGQPVGNSMQAQANTPAPSKPSNAEINEQIRQEEELQALTEYYTRKAEITIANEKDIDEQLLQLDMEYRDRREELLRTRLEDGLITQQEFNNELAQLEIEAAELQIALEEKQTEKTQEQLEKRKKLYESYTKAVKSVTDSLTSILGSVAGTLEEGTQEWKGVMIAKSVIETIAGGITAYMTTMREVGGGVQGIIAGAAAAAAVLATGYAEVAKIRATDVSGSGAGSTSGSTNLGGVNPSAVNVNATQVTATRAVQTQEDIANLPDTRVYVTEEDITNAQRRVRVTHENATY